MKKPCTRLNCTRRFGMPVRCALARLELEQEGVAAAADRAQLVELGVVAGAITPPSRSSAAGSSASAERSRPAIAGGGDSASAQHREQERAVARQRSRARRGRALQRRPQAGQLARPRLAQGDAGGDPLDVGQVAQRRAQRLERRRRAAPRSPRGAGSRPGARAAAGSASARRARLPMPVAQPSSVESRVGASWPRSVRVSSRLRCVVGGRSISSLARCTVSRCTWASARPWVCSA